MFVMFLMFTELELSMQLSDEPQHKLWKNRTQAFALFFIPKYFY